MNTLGAIINSCIMTLAALLIVTGCAPDRPARNSLPGRTTAPTTSSPARSTQIMTPRQALREAAPHLCKPGTVSEGCRLIRQFSKGVQPIFPMGKRLTVGKAFVMDTALGNDIHQRILILWSFRDSEFPLVRLYDPDPENDRETNDALAVANSLKSGKPVPANGFTRFLSTVSRTVNLYSAHPAENALWFKGSETIKTNQTQRSIEYFIRQNDDMYTIIFMTRRDDGTTRYAIAELPGPALSIPPRQLK